MEYKKDSTGPHAHKNLRKYGVRRRVALAAILCRNSCRVRVRNSSYERILSWSIDACNEKNECVCMMGVGEVRVRLKIKPNICDSGNGGTRMWG